MYKMPFKSDNLSLGMIVAQKKHKFWAKNAKNGENDKFSLFLTNVTPWKLVFKGHRITENA